MVMHAYPNQLADFALDNWPAEAPLQLSRRQLREILSICFQASLVPEEGREVRFRAVICPPEAIPLGGARDEWLLLKFAEPREFTPEEARRLSPAAPFQTTLLGVSVAPERRTLWGLVQTGAGWLTPTWGGRSPERQARELPIVQVLGMGRLALYCGENLIASLERGYVETITTDVFDSAWLPGLFRQARQEVVVRFATDRPGTAPVEESLIAMVSQHMVRRCVFLIRSARHGGLLLFQDDTTANWSEEAGPLRFKYTMCGDSRGRYRDLMQRLLGVLAQSSRNQVLTWQQFIAAEDPQLQHVEQSIFELSRLIAGLAAVDGAVVLNKRFEVLGFGAEVGGELPSPRSVWQALDVNGERMREEPANSVGTRHRAAYRFVAAHPEGLAIVISHDGAVRFVASIGGRVAYFEQYLNW